MLGMCRAEISCLLQSHYDTGMSWTIVLGSGVAKGGAGGANAPPQIVVVPLLQKTLGLLGPLSTNKIFLKSSDRWR